MRWLWLLLVFLILAPLSSFAEVSPFPYSLGLRAPMGWKSGAKFKRVRKHGGVETLPAKFSLRDKWGKYPEARNQGQCGSCWDFATTGAVERGYFWRTGVEVDLSEQAGLSCSKSGSCDGGYFDALNYFMKKGVPAEATFPYVARDVACKKGMKSVAWVKSWHYIGASFKGPQVDEIKAAIYTGVPVPVTVAADQKFMAYSGGVFEGKSCARKPGPTNHMVMLTGWDDATKTWELLNSWSPQWGEKGYMRIRYGCDRVGEVAAQVVLPTAFGENSLE